MSPLYGRWPFKLIPPREPYSALCCRLRVSSQWPVNRSKLLRDPSALPEGYALVELLFFCLLSTWGQKYKLQGRELLASKEPNDMRVFREGEREDTQDNWAFLVYRWLPRLWGDMSSHSRLNLLIFRLYLDEGECLSLGIAADIFWLYTMCQGHSNVLYVTSHLILTALLLLYLVNP